MSKYERLWNYIKNCGKGSITLTFEEIGSIADVPIDHSFFAVQQGADGVWLQGQENFHERTEGEV